jgi:hypothetical protein
MACNSTNCSYADMENLLNNLAFSCNPRKDSSGRITSANCQNSNCQQYLYTWMDHCMCIPDWCGWKSHPDHSKLKEILKKHYQMPPGAIQHIDEEVQKILDWCGDAERMHQRLRCPQDFPNSPDAQAAWAADLKYDCRYCGRPEDSGTVWAAQTVVDGQTVPTTGSWRATRSARNAKPDLGVGCKFDQNCNQVPISRGITCHPPYMQCQAGEFCTDGTRCPTTGSGAGYCPPSCGRHH